MSSRWTFHTGRVVSLAFSPSNTRLISGATDENIYLWTPSAIARTTAIKNAHVGGIAGVAWTSETEIISSGADGCVRTWEIAAAK